MSDVKEFSWGEAAFTVLLSVLAPLIVLTIFRWAPPTLHQTLEAKCAELCLESGAYAYASRTCTCASGHVYRLGVRAVELRLAP